MSRKTSEPRLELRAEVQIEWETDCDADLSHLGNYTDQWEEGAIDREERGDRDRNSYRYFVSANHALFPLVMSAE